MSGTELQRFAADAEANPGMLESWKGAADAAELAERLRRNGYDVSDEEIEAATRQSTVLSDEQLDAVGGGSVGVILLLGSLIAGGLIAGAAIASARHLKS